MASSVRVFNARFAGITGAEETQMLLAGIPAAVQALVQPALERGAQKLVDTYKEIAPVAPEFETHPGQMRDSAHVEENGRALSVSAVVDAEDAAGQAYPSFVEYGHTDKRSGQHVPAKPAFWPAYQVTKRFIRSEVQKGVRAGLKAAAGNAAS